MRLTIFAYALLGLTVHVSTAQLPRQPQETYVLSVRWTQYYSAVYHVPVELVMAIIDQESGWDPYAVSEKGAIGLMQLMPHTALRFGIRNLFRPDENIRGGVAYLAWLDREFGGDLRLVTAAYYVGEDPIRRRKLDYSSPNVQGYVRRVAERYRTRRRSAANPALVNWRGDEK
jgi:soluble lytic murein transglycosylase-like protein